MKRILILLVMLSLVFSACAAEEFRILTTFYPMYILTLNVTENIEGVSVSNMAEQTVGCLHDYTLQTQDMVKIEQADALIVNGGGMEQFMERVLSARTDLPVINALDGIEMEQSIEDGLLNAHVWMDPVLAMTQVKNIADGLAAADPDHGDSYRQNAVAYCARLEALDSTLCDMLKPLEGVRIITFHEAFNYFAERYGMVVAGVIANEPGEEPSTRDIAETCDLVKELDIKTLFTEPQYPATAAQIIARETGASIYVLDPCVSGEESPAHYEAVQMENARILREAFEL